VVLTAKLCPSGASHLAFLRLNVPEVLHHLERAAFRAGDVHVHPYVVLAGHHLGGAPAPAPTNCRAAKRQRVAIARALVGSPAIVFADEPTGNLDQATGRAILELFEDLHSFGVTIVVISHDGEIAARLGRRIEMLDGQIVFDSAEELGS
jgi:ABC-type ATPase involved in cell division